LEFGFETFVEIRKNWKRLMNFSDWKQFRRNKEELKD